MSEKNRPLRCQRCGKNTVAIDWKILVPDGRPVYRCSNCDYRYTSGNPLKLQEAKIR